MPCTSEHVSGRVSPRRLQLTTHVLRIQATPPEHRTTFQQRYFVCDEDWKTQADGSKGPIFFYVGNEADVTLCDSYHIFLHCNCVAEVAGNATSITNCICICTLQ